MLCSMERNRDVVHVNVLSHLKSSKSACINTQQLQWVLVKKVAITKNPSQTQTESDWAVRVYCASGVSGKRQYSQWQDARESSHPWGEGWRQRVIVTKEKYTICHLLLYPLAIAQSLKAVLGQTLNSLSFPSQQQSLYRVANRLGSTRQPPAQHHSHNSNSYREDRSHKSNWCWR